MQSVSMFLVDTKRCVFIPDAPLGNKILFQAAFEERQKTAPPLSSKKMEVLPPTERKGFQCFLKAGPYPYL